MNLNFLFVRKYKKNREISMHSHNIYEFVYYIDGKGTTKCGDNIYKFEKDSYTIIAPSVIHSESHIGKGHILAIGFAMDDENLALETEMHNGFDPVIFSLVQKIKIEFVKKEKFYEKVIETLLYELTIYLKRNQLSPSSTKQSKNNDISFAISYMSEYFMTDINLDELAQSTGYCKDHFRILFKKNTGQTPKSFILSKKLSYAKKLLAKTETPLTSVATNCGFEYYSCFSSFFKKKTGVTPLQFRNQAYNSTI